MRNPNTRRFIEDLGAIDRRPGPVPAAVDEAILAEARRYLEGRRQRIEPRHARWATAGLAAAVLLIALAHVPTGDHARLLPLHDAARVAHVTGDIDGDGRLDIADALVLARAIENRGRLRMSWDVDRSGAVDAGDVAAIARAAVDLSRSHQP